MALRVVGDIMAADQKMWHHISHKLGHIDCTHFGGPIDATGSLLARLFEISGCGIHTGNVVAGVVGKKGPRECHRCQWGNGQSDWGTQFINNSSKIQYV